MISSISGADPATQSLSAPQKKSAVDKETFMQLLVAQVKNQNPLDPTDGVQFLTQLAQFSELEQMIEIRAELKQIGERLAPEPTTGETKNV